MKKKYPGRRTFAQWALLPYKERHAWVTPVAMQPAAPLGRLRQETALPAA